MTTPEKHDVKPRPASGGKTQAAASGGFIVWFEESGRADGSRVGGKNASLGEMVCHLTREGIRVPSGFATVADAYWRFVETNALRETIEQRLDELAAGRTSLAEAGSSIRAAFLRGTWPKDVAGAIKSAYQELCRRSQKADADVAVRSSATAEDLPDASFAGQQETFLNIRGVTALLDACRRCFASLFTDRAIAYRQAKGFDHLKVALSIGVQNMVRSDLGGAGVMFSVDTETGFDRLVVINAAWGLGENVVQGAVDPDEYQVYKPLLADSSFVPIVEKTIGEKAQKMIYATAGDGPTRNVPTSKAERRCICTHGSRKSCSSRAVGLLDRAPLRLPDGYGMGTGRRDRRFVYRAGASRNRTVAARGRHIQDPTASSRRAALLCRA